MALTVDSECFPSSIDFWTSSLTVDILLQQRAVEVLDVVLNFEIVRHWRRLRYPAETRSCCVEGAGQRDESYESHCRAEKKCRKCNRHSTRPPLALAVTRMLLWFVNLRQAVCWMQWLIHVGQRFLLGEKHVRDRPMWSKMADKKR